MWLTRRSCKSLASCEGENWNGKINDGRIDLADGTDHLKAGPELAELLDLKAESQIGMPIGSAGA